MYNVHVSWFQFLTLFLFSKNAKNITLLHNYKQGISYHNIFSTICVSHIAEIQGFLCLIDLTEIRLWNTRSSNRGAFLVNNIYVICKGE